MATSGWKDVTRADVAKMGRRQPADAVQVPKVSKYRNVRVVVDGEKFDSKREAAYWQELKYREKAGEIDSLQRQVPFDLMCPIVLHFPESTVVARYIADFVYQDLKLGHSRVVDAKGKRTAIYALKKKWLELQSGIVIEEV